MAEAANDFDSADAGSIVKTTPRVDEFTIARHRKINRAAWSPLTWLWTGMDEVALLAGGPSLANHSEEIEALYARGVKIACVNATCAWALRHSMWPTFEVVLGARETNAKFTHPPYPSTVYLLADQCHPSVFTDLDKTRTYWWDSREIRGGSTVTLCAIPILKKMGAKIIHVFGFDSCVVGNDVHHSYPQPENDGEPCAWVEINGEGFLMTMWMIAQVEDFLVLKDGWEGVKVYGDGAIAHLLRS